MKIKGEWLAACLTAVLGISGTLLAYSGGNGTAPNPYKIANVDDFLQLSTTPADWVDDKSFILTANIDLADHPFTHAPIAPDTDSAASDFQGTVFDGIFDGNGHVVNALTVTTSTKDFIGLFGYLGQYAKIRNLGLENVNITGRSYVGGLAGCSGFSKLTACYATGSVSGIGWYAGGLVGKGWAGALTDCYATCSVSGTNNVGGLVGDGWGTLTACYATGSVTGTNCVGGLAGEDRGLLTACYATGSVTGNEDVGGLVGFHCYGSLIACYATGSVTGFSRVGGLVGFQNGSSITACFSTGLVSGIGQFSALGGLLGKNWGSLSNCFWDMQTSGLNYSADGTGKSTADMKKIVTFLDADWDFVGESDNGTADRWRMCVNGVDYPRLAWEFSQIGDFECPAGVAMNDLLYFVDRWLATTPDTSGAADANSDGKVDLADLAVLSAHWLLRWR